jgi:hypothetical protein
MDVLGRVIGGFACLQLERLLSVGLEHHRPLQDIDEFIARMEMAARNGTRWNVGDEYHPFLPLDSGDRLAEEFGPCDRRRLVLRPDLADANSTQSNAYQIYTEKQKELAHWLSPSNEGLLISSPPEWLHSRPSTQSRLPHFRSAEDKRQFTLSLRCLPRLCHHPIARQPLRSSR